MKNIIAAAMTAGVLVGCLPGAGEDPVPAQNGTSIVIAGVENGFAGKCDGTLKDAEDMSNLLKPYSADMTVLKDKQATASAMLAAMEKAVRSDLAIIYFSGHGGSQPSSDAFEVDGNDEFICCYDRGVLDNRIWEIVCKAKGRVFLIFDCCHSETMFRTPGVTFSSRAGKALRAGTQPRMLCWSGCPDSSYSYGSASGGEFTTALRKYASQDKTYAEVWKKIAEDGRLKSQQIVK